ncbi:MAG: hypothetical protein COB94_006775, partial [Gammaproteobacteria bacterium]|nr:hypothetical protein [Gammaproteobacteria bacterium]
MKTQTYKLGAFLFPLVMVAFMLSLVAPRPVSIPASILELRVELKIINVRTASELAAQFDRLNYHWPLAEGAIIPALALQVLPSDFSEISDVKQKKSLFFRALLPIVLAENKIVEDIRAHVVELFGKDATLITESERRWLNAVAAYYKVRGDVRQSNVRQA